jgi:cell division protein FtsB
VGKIGTETTLNTGDVTGILMIAVQTLSEQNEQAKLENQDLRNEIKDLRDMVQKLLAEKGTPNQNYSATP